MLKVSSPLPSSIISLFHVSDLAYADEIVILNGSYRELQTLVEDVNRRAAAVGMRINAPITKVMSAFIPGDQRQAFLLDGEHLEGVGIFKYIGSVSSPTVRATR